MTVVEQYLNNLKQAYDLAAGESYWQGFIERIHGASNDDIAKLKDKFPLIPQSLIKLLQFVDGTYWQEYQGESIAVYMFGSIPDNHFGYPCYLTSSAQMLGSENEYLFLKDFINRKLDPESGIVIDDKITDDFNQLDWLHVSDCMNNGGTSSLYIDFSPSDTGNVGQVVMYLHDPDELTVIADSFDEYLQKLIDSDMAFIQDYLVDENLWQCP